MNKKRIEWIDVSRAVGMLLIICNHSVGGSYGAGFFGKFCFAVSVPIFFVLSGYLFREKKILDVIKNGFLNLILPYLMTVLLIRVVSSLNAIFPNRVFASVPEYWLGAFYGLGTPTQLPNGLFIPAIGAIWFLLAMFVGNILFQIGIKMANQVSKNGLLEIYIFIAVVVGYWSGEYIKLPWSINAAMFSQVFYYFGYQIKKYNLVENSTLSLTINGFILWVISALSGYFYLNVPSADNIFLSLVGGVGGSYFVMVMSKVVSEKVNLSWITCYGKLSLIVLSIHLVELNTFNVKDTLWQPIFNLTHSELLAIYGVVGYRIIVTTLAVILIPKVPILRSFYLNRNYPFLRKSS